MTLLPKPETRRTEKRRQRRHRHEVVRTVRAVVLARDQRCRSCGVRHATLEMHELRSRAQLRGRSPEDIFNTENCLMLCRQCHQRVTERRITIEPCTDRGADGQVTIMNRS